MKTNQMTGAALDWAVAKCEGAYSVTVNTDIDGTKRINYGGMHPEWSTDWAQGGPIIEREFITIDQKERSICACIDAPEGHECNDIWANGPTPLVAAMRCYVASKLGADVDLPEGLA